MLLKVVIIELGFTLESQNYESTPLTVTNIDQVHFVQSKKDAPADVDSMKANKNVNRLVGADKIEHEKAPFLVAFNMMR